VHPAEPCCAPGGQGVDNILHAAWQAGCCLLGSDGRNQQLHTPGAAGGQGERAYAMLAGCYRRQETGSKVFGIVWVKMASIPRTMLAGSPDAASASLLSSLRMRRVLTISSQPQLRGSWSCTRCPCAHWKALSSKTPADPYPAGRLPGEYHLFTSCLAVGDIVCILVPQQDAPVAGARGRSRVLALIDNLANSALQRLFFTCRHTSW